MISLNFLDLEDRFFKEEEESACKSSFYFSKRKECAETYRRPYLISGSSSSIWEPADGGGSSSTEIGSGGLCLNFDCVFRLKDDGPFPGLVRTAVKSFYRSTTQAVDLLPLTSLKVNMLAGKGVDRGAIKVHTVTDLKSSLVDSTEIQPSTWPSINVKLFQFFSPYTPPYIALPENTEENLKCAEGVPNNLLGESSNFRLKLFLIERRRNNSPGNFVLSTATEFLQDTNAPGSSFRWRRNDDLV